MSKAFFRGMTKAEREQFWLSLYSKYQKYSGTLVEFLKEHEISASAFARWSYKFKSQQQGIIDNKTTDNNCKHSPFANLSEQDKHIQKTVDSIDDIDLDTAYDDFDKERPNTDTNEIMGSIEVIFPQGTRIRISNHADLSIVARLISVVNQYA
jgi:hypothetical protein